MNFCCGKNKDNIFRRLFQCFKKRVKRSYRQHMYFINNINLIFSFCRTVRHLFPNLTDIINAVIRRRVNLNHIHSTCRDRLTHLALTARTAVNRMLTVYRFRKYFRNRCFSRTSCTAEKICMSDTVCLNLIL